MFIYRSNPSDAPDNSAVDALTDKKGRIVLSPDSAIESTVTTNTSIGDDRKVITTAGTRETLVSSSTPSKSVVITALISNTGTVVVGGSTVIASQSTRRGTPLIPGQAMSIDIDDLVKVYIDVTVSGEGVTYTYVN